MQAKKQVPYTAPPGTPAPAKDVSDMDAFHKMAKTDKLADLFVKLARGPNSSGVK